MNEYIIDHSGSCRANDKSEKNPEGTLYAYEKGKPVYLPDDVAHALGESAKPTGRTKEAKNILNKMVGASDAKTK